MSDEVVRTFTEAPFSWNVRYIDADGFDCQLTIRGMSGKEVLTSAQSAIDWLLDQGVTPKANGGNHAAPSPAAAEAGLEPRPDWCPIHQVAMKYHEKDGHGWYSHKAGSDWCRGK